MGGGNSCCLFVVEQDFPTRRFRRVALARSRAIRGYQSLPVPCLPRPPPSALHPSDEKSQPSYKGPLAIGRPLRAPRKMLKALAPANAFHGLRTPRYSGLIVCSSSASRRSPDQRRAVAPSVRRPTADRCSLWNHRGSATMRLPPDEGASPSAPAVHVELELFLELVSPRMRRDLARHEEIRELIEVVMDLGRKPIARFPSGDWIMSEQPIGVEDLRQAISKVTPIQKRVFFFFKFFPPSIPRSSLTKLRI